MATLTVGSTEPRIFTPPLRPLTPETSLGFEVLEFADALGIFLYPWQRWLLVHALELNPDGTFRFRTVLILVGRQNGKSTVMQVLTLWRMFVDAAKLTIGTAQNLEVAEEQWQDVVNRAEDIPHLAEMVAKVDYTNGKHALRLRTGERYKIAAATRRGGRGLSGDLVLLDELREHTNWDAWSAVTKTTLARPRSQVWCASNAGDAMSVVLRFLRNQAHAALGNPDGLDDLGKINLPTEDPDAEGASEFSTSLGIFEWSAPRGMAKWNRAGWAMANPSLEIDTPNPDEKMTVAAIAAACGTDPDKVFKTEVLCQWPETAQEGPYPMVQWEASLDQKSARVGRYSLCVDVSADGKTAYVGMAGMRSDGLLHVQVVAARSSMEWVKDWLLERVDDPDFSHVAIQAHGAPVSPLLLTLQAEEKLEKKVIPWTGSALGQGFMLFWSLVCGFDPDEPMFDLDELPEDSPERVRPPLLRHKSQPVLDLAVQQAATKPSGDSWLLDRTRSPVDIAPLIAVNGAAWVFTAHKPVVKKRSRYEDEDADIASVEGL